MKKIIGVAIPAFLGTFLTVSPAFASTSPSVTVPSGFQAQSFAQVTTSQVQPDDITNLNGNIFVAYQDGVGTKGEPSATGVKQSTVVEYNNTGKTINQWSVTGKVDGMTADPANNRVIATVNEDGNSSMYIITPGANNQVEHLTYAPDAVAKATLGGTDSIAIINGKYYLSASNPTPDSKGNFTNAALFQANIDTANGTVSLAPALMGNATATDALTNKPVTLNLSDPDSSILVPQGSPKFAGDLMLDSQGDQELIFVHNIGAQDQSQTKLPLSAQVDDVVWATSTSGTLYVTDNKSDKLYAIKGTFQPGTVFASLGSSVDTLNLSTGKLTPFATGLSSSHGILFVPGSAPVSTTTTTKSTTTPSKTSTPSAQQTAVKGATSPTTGLPLDEMLFEGVGLLALGGSSLAFLRRRK